MVGDARAVRVLRRYRQMRRAERGPAVAVTAPAIFIAASHLSLRLNPEVFETPTLRREVALELVDGFLGGIVRRHDRQPALTEACRAAEQTIDAASEPDRDLAAGKRVDACLRHRVILAAKRQRALFPERAHQLDLFLLPGPSLAEARAEPLVLDLVPARADTEPQAAAGQQIHVGSLLRDQRRLPLGQHQDGGDELDSLR